jgi:hypothetical protein
MVQRAIDVPIISQVNNGIDCSTCGKLRSLRESAHRFAHPVPFVAVNEQVLNLLIETAKD